MVTIENYVLKRSFKDELTMRQEFLQRQMQMTKEPINTVIFEKFFQQVKVAEQSNQKEIRLSLTDAKNLALTLGK